MKFRSWAILLLVSFSLGLTSCDQASESDDLARAQKCLDDVPGDNPSAASNCLAYVEKYSSQQASILKCSILMTSGGLIESKLIKAYKALKDTSISESNRTTAYMAVLSLESPDASGGYTKAVQADVHCQASGIPGMKFLAGVVVAGSYMAKVIAALPGNVEIGNILDDPTAINNAIQDLLNPTGGCTDPDVGDVPAACGTPEELAQLGTVVANLSTAYCANEKADAKICGSVNDALAAAGSNSTDIGQALMCMLKGKGFDTTTHLCKP